MLQMQTSNYLTIICFSVFGYVYSVELRITKIIMLKIYSIKDDNKLILNFFDKC